MDDRKFDALTRKLSGRVSRRHTLFDFGRGVVAATAGAVGLSVFAQETGAKRKKKKKKGKAVRTAMVEDASRAVPENHAARTVVAAFVASAPGARSAT